MQLLAIRSSVQKSNRIGVVDFIDDQPFAGRKVRVLTIVNMFTRFSPAIDVHFACKGINVDDTLARVARQVGHPKTVRLY